MSLAACPSSDSQAGGPDNPPPAKQSCPANDNNYSWCSNNPDNSSQSNSQPSSGSHSTPDMSSHRWGDYKFGDCGVSLYPPTIGLTLTPGTIPTVDLRAGTACVGYPPKEFTLHIHIYRWVTNDAGKAPYWHEIFTDPWPIADHSLPPVATLGPDGEIPWALQRQITARVACTPNNVKGQPTLYKLQIDMLGTSISGEPIVGGGETTPVVVPWDDCAGARR